VSDVPVFRSDLYRDTAEFYDKFRLPYPRALIDDLCQRVAPTRNGRLLDLACGPGTVTFALADRFAEVVAVDLEPETVAYGQQKARAHRVRNIEWATGAAEDVDPRASFDLVTIGSAFHRLDRRRVAALAMQWLRNGGHLALLWNALPINPENTEPWQQCMRQITVDWLERLGATDRVPENLETHLDAHPTHDVLQEAGFSIVGKFEFVEAHEWTVPELIGLMYSTSVLSRPTLGDHIDAFERDVEERMLAIDADGIFRENVSFAYDLAYRASESRT